MAAPPLPPPDPQFVLRGTQSPVHALHFCRGAQGQGHPLLLSGALSGLVHIWSLQTWRTVATLDGHRGQCVTWLQTLPQGHQLLSQGRDLRVCLWDLAEGRNTVVDSVYLESVGFCRSSVLAGGRQCWMLATPGRGSDEPVWGPRTSWENGCFPCSHLECAWTRPLESFTGLCPDNAREDVLPPCPAIWVATLAQTKQFFLLETKLSVECQVGSKCTSVWGGCRHGRPEPRQGKSPPPVRGGPGPPLLSGCRPHSPTALRSGLGLPAHRARGAISPFPTERCARPSTVQATQALCPGTSPLVQILEMPSKTSVCTLKPEAGAKPGMPMCLELWQADSSPRPLLLAGYEDGSVALWDISERKVCSRIACHTEPIMGLDFDSQKARGVSGSAEKALAVWSLDEQQTLQVCRTHELTNPGIADVKIRPDRKILATAGWDHRIRVFHWRTMKPLAVLAFHSATVHCVAFATDGLLAAGSRDQRISVWLLYPRM
ncbi:hypothetical protein MC885_000926 [Smutsia gigantea]|nr:hypothetical protein MC885_000926 [Smutsia gigantea]